MDTEPEDKWPVWNPNPPRPAYVCDWDHWHFGILPDGSACPDEESMRPDVLSDTEEG